MIIRESGMPAQAYWETLFGAPLILVDFGFTADPATSPPPGDIAELGCGYGTFTLPLAARLRGTVHTFDIDPALVATTTARLGLTADLREGAALRRRHLRRDHTPLDSRRRADPEIVARESARNLRSGARETYTFTGDHEFT